VEACWEHDRPCWWAGHWIRSHCNLLAGPGLGPVSFPIHQKIPRIDHDAKRYSTLIQLRNRSRRKTIGEDSELPVARATYESGRMEAELHVARYLLRSCLAGVMRSVGIAVNSIYSEIYQEMGRRMRDRIPRAVVLGWHLQLMLG
jgi:hypothetical protein